MTDWKTWPKCVFFFVFVFLFVCLFVCLFFLSSRRVRFESVTALKYGTWFWMNKIQDRTQSWRSLLFKVFHCVCHIFSCIFWQASSQKNWKKIKQAKKKKKSNLEFCWIKCAPKNKCGRQLWDIGFILFSFYSLRTKYIILFWKLGLCTFWILPRTHRLNLCAFWFDHLAERFEFLCYRLNGVNIVDYVFLFLFLFLNKMHKDMNTPFFK